MQSCFCWPVNAAISSALAIPCSLGSLPLAPVGDRCDPGSSVTLDFLALLPGPGTA